MKLIDFFRRYWGRFFHEPDKLMDNAERLVCHRFANRSLLRLALTHRSYLVVNGQEHSCANEVLEFLGDAVLDMVVVEHLYRSYPFKREGDLSKMKSSLVSGHSLNQIGAQMELGKYILMSDNEARNGGRLRESILEDTFEALVAAIYLDGGIKPAKLFIERYVLSRINDPIARKSERNFKSLLLEFSQGHGLGTPVYRTILEDGPDHCKRFEVEVLVGDQVLGRGAGANKKAAQQQAASMAVETISNQRPDTFECQA